MGFHGVDVKNSDRFVLDVIANLLSGQGGRLFEELRGRRALAYAVGCYQILGVDPGAFIFYISTSPQEVDEAIQGIMREVEHLKMGKIFQEELEQAKRNLIGRKQLQLQTNSSQAFEAALSELYGLGYSAPWRYSEFVEGVSLEDVKRVTNLYFQTNKCSLAILKPKE
jgi:zinc protease